MTRGSTSVPEALGRTADVHPPRGLAGTGRVFYLFEAGGPPARALARFTDGADARSAVNALERLGRRATLLSRDESRDRPRPSFWRLEHTSPARPGSRCARGDA